MATIKNVDEASVEKKLVGAKNTQESIQSLSLWALHHKAQHDNIVRIWLNILKKCELNSFQKTNFLMFNLSLADCCFNQTFVQAILADFLHISGT